jgi:hypothetical protein
VSHFATDGFALLRADSINKKPPAVRAAPSARTGTRTSAVPVDKEVETEPMKRKEKIDDDGFMAQKEESEPEEAEAGGKRGGKKGRGGRKGKGKGGKGGRKGKGKRGKRAEPEDAGND